MEIDKQKTNRVYKKKIRGIESYSSIIFKTIGVTLILLAIYYYFDTGNGNTINNLSKILSNKSNRVYNGDNLNLKFSWEIFNKLLACFIPGILGLCASIFYHKKNKTLFYYLSVAIIIFLTLAHATIFANNWLPNYIFSYHNYYIVSGFILVPIAVFILNYLTLKRSEILTFTTIYFYVLLFELLIIRYSYTYTYVFCCIIIYTVIVHLISKKQEDTYNNIVNTIFAYGFLAIFILRQLIYNSNTAEFELFFSTNLLYFLLFNGISLSFLFQDKKPIYKLFYWINLILFLYINAIILNKYFTITYNILPIIGVIIVNGLSIYLNKKTSFLQGKIESVEISTLLLISLLFTLLFQEYSFEIFFGTLAVCLIFYAKAGHNRILLWASAFLVFLLILKLVYLIIGLTLIITKLQSINEEFISSGFINIGIIVLAIWIVKNSLQSTKFRVSNKWLNREKFLNFLSTFNLVSLFVFIIWISFSLLLYFVGDLYYSVRVFAIVSSILVLYISKYEKTIYEKESIKFQYLTFLLFIILTFIGFYEFPYTFKYDITYEGIISIESLFHYAEFLLEIALGYKILSAIINTKTEKSYFKDLIIVVTSLFGIITVCKEFDFITVLYYTISQHTFKQNDVVSILDYNHIIPYSIILLICLIIILLIGLIENNKFLRLFSIFVAFCVLLKVFYIEYFILTKNDKITIIIITGVTFLLISSIYSRIKQRRSKRSNI
ncbi:MAG: hypothetical protein NT048_05630 [Flavobacterium sp.]|nr:hypothetical protein [Flavobacterium sp.]